MVTNSEVHEVIKKAAKLIENPNSWLKGVLAKDDIGRSRAQCENENVQFVPCQFCMAGALTHASESFDVKHDSKEYELYQHAVMATAKAIMGGSNADVQDASTASDVIVSYNDEPNRTHMQALASFEVAILNLENNEDIEDAI